MPTVFLQSVPERDTGLCTDVIEGRKWWIARCRDQWRGVAAEAQGRNVAIMNAALLWNGTGGDER